MGRLLSGVVCFAIGAVLALQGCSGERESALAATDRLGEEPVDCAKAPARDPVASKDSIEHPFEEELLSVAAAYTSWGRVDEEAHRGPAAGNAWVRSAGRVYESASSDDQTHGRLLYSVFARNRADYVTVSAITNVPVGQIVVKQSWISEEMTDMKELPEGSGLIDEQTGVTTPARMSGQKSRQDDDERDYFYPFYPYVQKDGKVFKASRQADLFIMMKLDPTTPGTDAGWIYGTVAPDGKTVKSSGKIESCVKCHLEANADRLFGLPRYRKAAALLEIGRLGGRFTIAVESRGPLIDGIALDSVRRNRADDNNLILLQHLTALKKLWLDNSQVTDVGMTHLASARSLEVLGLSETRVGDEGIARLAGLRNLLKLDLAGTRVTDAGLAHLKGLTGLETLGLGKTLVTDEGVADLKRALPGLKINR